MNEEVKKIAEILKQDGWKKVSKDRFIDMAFSPEYPSGARLFERYENDELKASIVVFTKDQKEPEVEGDTRKAGEWESWTAVHDAYTSGQGAKKLEKFLRHPGFGKFRRINNDFWKFAYDTDSWKYKATTVHIQDFGYGERTRVIEDGTVVFRGEPEDARNYALRHYKIDDEKP